MIVEVHNMLTKKKDVNLDKVIQLALADSKILKEILKGIVSKKDVF
ncbi:MAG: hypothetical protein ACFFCZ_21835 [Promethearchaeota archaeon]